MVIIKSGKAEGLPAKFVVKEGLSKEETNLFLDLISNSEFYREYILLLVDTQDLKGLLKGLMLEKIPSGEICSNGSYFIKSEELAKKIEVAEKYSDLARIYTDFKFTFSK